MFGDGPVPVGQDMSVKDDDSGFLDVARLTAVSSTLLAYC